MRSVDQESSTSVSPMAAIIWCMVKDFLKSLQKYFDVHPTGIFAHLCHKRSTFERL